MTILMKELCVLCNQVSETIDHLCRACPFTRKVWDSVRLWFGAPHSMISTAASVDDWWKLDRARLIGDRKRDFDGLINYIFWSVWMGRNRRIFQHQDKDEDAVTFSCYEEHR
ncbi:hypothetical protein BRADI_1g56957v3, partial [Brachypodium distachyon]